MDVKPPETKATPKAKAPKWKTHNGRDQHIPSPFGMVKVTEADLSNPKIIAMLTEVEKQRGIRLFGTVFVKDE